MNIYKIMSIFSVYPPSSILIEMPIKYYTLDKIILNIYIEKIALSTIF